MIFWRMANRKAALNYSQISSGYLSCDAMRRIVRQIRRKYQDEDTITQIKLLIIATWLLANRTEGCGYYIIFDARYLDVIAEDTNLDDDKIEEYINYLVEIQFYDESYFHSHKILTNKDIQAAYFCAVSRMKREMSVSLPYLLVDIDTFVPRRQKTDGRMDYSEESKQNSRQIQDISLNKGYTSEERKDTSEERVELSDECGIISPIEAESTSRMEQFPLKQIENSSSINREKYIEDIRSWSGTEVRSYHHDEDFFFYVIFFMADAINPSAEVKKFITYNESHGWSNTRGTPYDTPRKRIALASEYSDKQYMTKGRMTIPGLPECHRQSFVSLFYAYLWDVYLFYRSRSDASIQPHYVLNANTGCAFEALADKRYDLTFMVGTNTREQCLRDSDYLLLLAQKYFPSIREIHWTLANNQLHTIVPSK